MLTVPSEPLYRLSLPFARPCDHGCDDPCPVPALYAEPFLSQLLRNDWLYNTVFWGVADAVDQGRLSAAEAPPFLVQYLNRLG